MNYIKTSWEHTKIFSGQKKGKREEFNCKIQGRERNESKITLDECER